MAGAGENGFRQEVKAVVVLAGTRDRSPNPPPTGAAQARRNPTAPAIRKSESGTGRHEAVTGKAGLKTHRRMMRPPTHVTTCLLLAAAFALSTACQRATPPRAHAEGTTPAATTAAAPATAPAPDIARWDDSDADGLPDRAELRSYNDRENFRSWFTFIAERQFYAASAEWDAAQRDCAGLVRFAWREALRRHDRAWARRMGEGYDSVAPDVRAVSLERGPLGEKIFRTDFGAFQESDLAAGKFSEFADARTLKDFNAEFVGRDRRAARAGDLLFFHQPWVQKYPYHVMLYLGAPRARPRPPRRKTLPHRPRPVQGRRHLERRPLRVRRRAHAQGLQHRLRRPRPLARRGGRPPLLPPALGAEVPVPRHTLPRPRAHGRRGRVGLARLPHRLFRLGRGRSPQGAPLRARAPPRPALATRRGQQKLSRLLPFEDSRLSSEGLCPVALS